jgi:Fe-S cluster assembly protein SufD
MDLNLKIATITDQYSRLYEANRETIFAGSSSFVNEKREKAIKAFQQLSFPGRKSEDYKYTNLEKLFEKDLKHVFNPKKIDFELEDIFTCDIPELDTHVVLVLNGFYYSTGELLEKLDNGIIFGSLQEASKNILKSLRNIMSNMQDPIKNRLRH